MLSSTPIGLPRLSASPASPPVRRASLSRSLLRRGFRTLSRRSSLLSSPYHTTTPSRPLFFFSRSLMEQQLIQICRQPLEEPEMFWAPIEQAEQELYGFLGDLQLSIASGSPSGLQIENYGAHDEDAVLILPLLEGPQDVAILNDWLSGDLHPSSLLDTNVHYQTKCRKSGRRGSRKRRTSPWNPMFFERRVSREYKTRKNNSRWTAEEVERLVQGVFEFNVGRWTLLKRKFFKTSIRTAVNLKDKWRNLLKAYQENSKQTAMLYLRPSLVEQIRKLAAKQSYPNKRHK